jgi:general secretion pathway protein G
MSLEKRREYRRDAGFTLIELLVVLVILGLLAGLVMPRLFGRGEEAKVTAAKVYLEKSAVPKDPWGNAYVYVSPGTKGPFDLYSYGADGAPGGEGRNKDLTSQDEQ